MAIHLSSLPSVRAEWLLFAAITLILLLRLQSFLAFHIGAELFCVAVMLYMGYRLFGNPISPNHRFLVILGIGLSTILPVLLLHILTYKGMTLWNMANVNQATQFWIIGKYMEAFTFLGAILFARHDYSPLRLLLFLLPIPLFAIGLVFSGAFFDCYIDGQGLTDFKIASEYIVIALLLLGLTLSQRLRGLFTLANHLTFILGIALTMLSGFMFTLYQDVHGLLNLIGHLLKMLSYAALVLLFTPKRFEI